MKRLTSAIAALLLAVAVLVSSGAFAGSSATADSSRGGGYSYSFERFLQRYEGGQHGLRQRRPVAVVGDHRREGSGVDLRRFGGLGDAGIEAVNQRYLLAARAFQPSGAEVDFEYLVKDVRGRLAYTVAIERAEVLYAGHTQPSEQVLRSTMIFRRDRGDWKIVHRHADTMVDLELPTP